MVLEVQTIKRFWIIYGSFSGLIGGYQGIRAYNISHQRCPQTNQLIKTDHLMGDRILGGIVSGLLHMLPGWNLVALTRLVNRIDIQRRGVEKDPYFKQYEEFNGYNLSTF